ncbi:MAG: type III-A CRISPR-associated RAMP protein Csm3 [Nitrospirae bacterium]|nr:type III-A CRISPR-associated RAMP protein Csm3 [Nitrospirota bacterium]
MKLKGYKTIEGIIKIITGLHIGGNTSIIEIGGRDNPVIRHPVTKEPYIPGSSLKGKMRSLLEWKLDKITSDGDVHKCNVLACPICILFGTSADEYERGPSRLIFRDAVLSKEYKYACKDRDFNWTPIDITEEKYENSINRITARANPRNFERIVSGAMFTFSIIYRDIDMDNIGTQDFLRYVIEGLELIEKDALGGAGSRGCGQVEFRIKTNNGESSPQGILNDLITNKTKLDIYFPTEKFDV